jgi:hypothetical protein
MKILKSAVVAFSLAIAMGSFSTAAVAEAGRIHFKPIDAVKAVQDHISAAEAAINNGAPGTEVAAHIKKAADTCEEINANDRVSRENSKVIKSLKGALAAAKADNFQESKDHLAKAKATLEVLKKLI